MRTTIVSPFTRVRTEIGSRAPNQRIARSTVGTPGANTIYGSPGDERIDAGAGKTMEEFKG